MVQMAKVRELFENMQLSDNEHERPAIIQQWLSKRGNVVSSFAVGISNTCWSCTDVTTECGLRYQVAYGSQHLLDQVLKMAPKAQQEWLNIDPEEKTQAIYAVARNFQKHVALFSTAEAVSFPFKRLEKCRGAYATNAIEYLYSTAARRCSGKILPRCSAVIVIQGSDSYPMNLIAEWRIGEAWSAHTPVVLAVSPSNCLPALIFSDICLVAGFPANFLNVVILRDSDLGKLQPITGTVMLSLEKSRPSMSTCIIAEGADIGSAVNGVMEMLSDCWGMKNYLGIMVYIQDCIQSRVMKALKAQMGSLKIAKSNFAKTADLVAHSDVQIIKAAHIPQKTKNTAPTVYIQGFRTIKEVASLASVDPLHSEYLSIWTEYVARAVEIAERIYGFRYIWINGQNHFYNNPTFLKELYFPSGKMDLSEKISFSPPPIPNVELEHVFSNVDCTLKLYYDGGQKHAESQTCYPVFERISSTDRAAKILAYVPAAGPKDACNAVEAALKAFPGWSSKSAFSRLQIIYFFGENLNQRKDDFIEKLSRNTGHSDCAQELQESIDAIFKWASYRDTDVEGFVSSPGMKLYSSQEPHGVIAIICPPIKVMRSLVTLLISAISIGNTVVIVVPEEYPIAPLMLAQVIDTSDIPAGVINILSGNTNSLLTTLAAHVDVKALWCWANRRCEQANEGCEKSEKRSVWWFNINPKNPVDVWPDKELDSYRGNKKYVWLPCLSVFSN
ncbi:aldehyde dehydrogenase family 16 member A1-like isoform X2 [Varroa destructor]|uniref:Aldehyde dehydrogenase domain-containing protein n=1 Tax=Varroa destructor TaxID=109461 RepID=A0A7M7KEP0_VARDE|nr:aldehyde dehydrogenase family 16 member A1-like isoform X2 [Varroa destructor]